MTFKRNASNNSGNSCRKARFVLLLFTIAMLLCMCGCTSGESDYILRSRKQKLILTALLNYEDEHGCLPPATSCSESGEPLLSWRVLILPYLEHGYDELYSRFKLNEPWDSVHNSELISECPFAFTSDADDTPVGQTEMLAVAGKGTAWSGKPKLDVVRREVLLVCSMPYSGVTWTQPQDLDIQQFVDFMKNNKTQLLEKCPVLSSSGCYKASFLSSKSEGELRERVIH